MDLRNLRKEYTHSAIRDKDLPEEPFQWFRDWFHDAIESGEANHRLWFYLLYQRRINPHQGLFC